MRPVRTFVVFATLAACNSITGTGKYSIDDDAGSHTTSSGSTGSSGASGTGANAECQTDAGNAFPQCSLIELENNIRVLAGDSRIIKAPGGDQEAPYVPNCMKIKVGQTVTWQGNLDRHPLMPRENSAEPNPIPTSNPGDTTISATFPCPGFYNFSCSKHQDSMLGTIWVVP
jgi:plastocyanin